MPKTYLLKRIIDIILAFGGIVFFLPFWLLFSFLIWLEAKGKIFYIQNRAGKARKIFKTLKFRTLYAEESGYMGSTRLGQFLRVTALDESLQLINILKGEMSFVGPRPLIPEEISNNQWENPRFSVKPGLTGLSQVFISKDSSIEEKFKYDILYIKNQGLFLDLKLLFLSFIISFIGGWEKKRKISEIQRRLFNSLQFK